MNYDGYFLHALARLRDERRYRVFADRVALTSCNSLPV
jgi:hypothetical protein